MANSRITTLQKSVRFFFRMLFWLPVTGFSLLLVYNTLPYFSFNKGFDFIKERSILFQGSLYNACFYIHIFAGVVCSAQLFDGYDGCDFPDLSRVIF